MKNKIKHFNIEECSICLEDLNEYNKMIKLKCNHIFHKNCLYEWSKNSNKIIYNEKSKIILMKGKCPLCNYNYIEKLDVIKNNKCCIIL
jgi:hypothetical protein